MITDKNFYIYKKYKGFYLANFNLLNPIGQRVFAFLNYLYKNNNPYFKFIDSIKVSSQDRPNSKNTSAHYHGKAIDIIISPSPYMCYIAGIMSACLNYNIYLGTVITTETGQVKNLHLHIDNYFAIRKNSKFIESPNGKLYSITEKNIDYILNLYGYFGMSYAQDLIFNVGSFQRETKKYLLTKYPVGQKLPFKDVIPFNIIKEGKEAAEGVFKYGKIGLIIVLSLTGLYLINKITPVKHIMFKKEG